MAITAAKYITGKNAADLNAKIATEIAASRYPVGSLGVRPTSIYPAFNELSICIATGATSVTAQKVLEADTLTDLAAQVTTEIAASNLPIGGVISAPVLDGGYNGISTAKGKFYQIVGH